MDDSGQHNVTRWLSEIRDPELAQQAWAKLIPRLFPILAARARELGLSHHDRDSAQQDCHERLFEKISTGGFTITNRSELFATFATIAYGKAVDKRRKLSRRKGRVAEFPEGNLDALDDGAVIRSWLEGDGPSQDELEEAQQLEQRFLAVVRADPKLEAFFVLVYERGLSVEEAAAALKISLATAYRRRRQLPAIARALRTDNDLSWLAETESDRGPHRATVRSFLAAEAQRTLDRVLSGENILDIGDTCAPTSTRGFMMLAEIDNVAHVIRYERQLSDLRNEIRTSESFLDNVRLRQEIAPSSWPIFEAWCTGMDARELLDTKRWSSEDLFQALRDFHEAARAIRETL